MLCIHKTEGKKMVEAFYREYLNRSIYKAMMWMMCGIALLLGTVWITMPFSLMLESIKTGDILMLLFLVICMISATGAYLRPYEVYNENEKFYPIEEFLKYLPINHRDFCIVKTKKVAVFQMGVFVVAMLFQTIASILAKTFSVWCMVYVFAVAFAIPFLVMTALIWIVPIRKSVKKRFQNNRIKYVFMHDMTKILNRISLIIVLIGSILVSLSVWVIDSPILFCVGIGVWGIGTVGVWLTGKN